jgi:AraC-like DNA-binding protein
MILDVPECLLPLMKRFMLESSSDLPGRNDMLASLGVQISHCIIRGMLELKNVEYGFSDRLEVNRAIEHIHSHLSEKLSSSELAEVACMSASHFSRVFKSETGLSPVEYLQKARLERAKKLILAGDLSITQVALSSGFSGGSYLTERFKSAFGMTPSEFRESMKSKK